MTGRDHRRRLAIVPAFNEEGTVGHVVDEIKRFDAELEVLVVDDGSVDRTARVAADHGAKVVRLPFNLGIGGAVQTGYCYAFEHGFDIAVQVDGDGQHDPGELAKLLDPIVAGRADMVVGTRFAGERVYPAKWARRVGTAMISRAVSLIVRQRITDATSGFRAVNRRGICLFAADYPHDYPEVEATVLVFRQKLTLLEIPVGMRARGGGRSSITPFRSLYYMIKVSLALVMSLLRRHPTPLEER